MFITLSDIHGNLPYVITYIVENNISDVDIIQVGDFGCGYTSHELESETYFGVNQLLSDRNIRLHIIRGNHDNPVYFQNNRESFIQSRDKWDALKGEPGKVDNGDYYDQLMSLTNINFVSDYSVLNIDNQNILCIGGAISIDRTAPHIVPHVNYWPDEKLICDINRIRNLDNNSIDYVITHNAPAFAYPVGWNQSVYNFADQDPALHTDLPTERNSLTKIHDELIKNQQIKSWFYGHFHQSHTEYIGMIKFRVLAECEFYLVR